MIKWTILGIKKTKDKDAIKNAYRAKLLSVNPEDDAEGFKELRKAYEDAIAEADRQQDEDKGLYEEGSLFGALQDLYKDFSRRRSVDEWQHIFEREEFVSLDKSYDSLCELLRFLMDNSFVPQSVFKLIVDTFSIEDRREELCNEIPAGFIDHMINNAKYSDPVNYDLFNTSDNLEKVDEFIHLFYRLSNTVNMGETEEANRNLEYVCATGIYHPYVEMCKIRNEKNIINQAVSSVEERREKYGDKLTEFYDRAKKLNEEYEGDVNLLILCGDMAIINSLYEEAKEYYEEVRQIQPDNLTIKYRMGEVYRKLGEFEKARDLYLDILDQDVYDENAHYGLSAANEGLIEKYKSQIEENPEDDDTKILLVWCYYRNSLHKEAVDLLVTFEPDEKTKFEYYNLLGRNYMGINQYEKALECFKKWISAIEEIPEEDDSEEAKKNRSRYCYAHYYLGISYNNLDDVENARKNLEIAISEEHEFINYAYEALARLEFQLKNYEGCLSICDKIKDSNVNFSAYLFMGKCFYHLGEYGNAIDALENAISISMYYSDPYVLMLDIFWECEEYDNVENVISRFDRLGYQHDKVNYYRGRMLIRDKEYEKASEIFLGILDIKGTDEAILDEDDYLNVFALLATTYERMNKDATALKYLEEGLDCIPGDAYFINRIAKVHHVLGNFEEEIKCCDLLIESGNSSRYVVAGYESKAAALCCMNKYEEAKSIYEALEAEYGCNNYYIIDHAELLVRMNRLDEAVELIENGIREVEFNSFVRTCMGNLCCFYGNEGYVDKALEVFNRVIENDPEDFHIYRTMGYVYLDHEIYEEAKKFFVKAMDMDKENEAYTVGLYLLAVSKADDINKEEYKERIEFAIDQVKDVDYAYAYIKKAEVYRAIGDYEEALKAIELAMKEKRGRETCFVELHDAWCEKGYIYKEKGEYSKAILCFEKAMEIFGHNGQYEDCINKCKELEKS